MNDILVDIICLWENDSVDVMSNIENTKKGLFF